MTYKKFYSIVITCIALLYPLIGFADGDGGYAGAFLRMGADARAFAMGNTGTGIASDATAIYWNPAGLSYNGGISLSSMNSFVSLDRRFNSVFFAGNAGLLGTFGIGWLGFGVGNIDGRDESGNPTDKFGDSENALFFSYARKILSLFSFGGNFKFLQHSLASASATGVGFDIGAMANVGNIFSVGLVIQDIASSLQWNTTHKDGIPLNIRIGAGIKPPIVPLIIGLDIEKNLKQGIDLHTGIEYTILRILSLRGGYGKAEGVSFGMGIKALMINADYGISFGNELGYTQRISLNINP